VRRRRAKPPRTDAGSGKGQARFEARVARTAGHGAQRKTMAQTLRVITDTMQQKEPGS
jgi:hypothetical protein